MHQAFFSISTTAGALGTYAVFTAGGDLLLSTASSLFQISKSVCAALTIVSLMYGLPLTETDRRWRVLPGRAGLLYLYPVATTATVPESVTLIILP
jgi:hypothetical protein